MDGEIAASAAVADDELPAKVPLNLNVEETAGGGCGSDSGVDVTPAVSCDSSLASGCYDPCKSPLGPFSPTETGGPSSLPCYPTAISCSRPSTPTWRRSADRQPCKLPGSMSSSFHFETARNSPPRVESPKRTDLNAVAKQSKVSTVKKLVSTYDMVKSLDKFATLPRRRRKSKENLAVTSATPAGNTVAPTAPREPSLNRAASLRRKHIEQGALAHLNGVGGGGSGTISGTTLPAKPTLPKCTRPPPIVARTKIYHEVCSQTCLTSEDITKVLSGSILPPVENRVETNDAEVQVGYSSHYFLFLFSSCKFVLTCIFHY